MTEQKPVELQDRLAAAEKRLRELRKKAKGSAYLQHRDASAQRQADQSAVGRDIGALPAVSDWSRRTKACRNLKTFCETYGERVFTLAWSKDHLRILKTLSTVCNRGGQFALAMPRASGKTAMIAWAALWAMLTGRRKMTVIVGADGRASMQMLETIVGEIEGNDLLLADFPEACFPVRKLEGINQRGAGQLCMGKRTLISMTADELVLPSVPPEACERPEQTQCGGAVVRCVGITGRIRGMQARTADGSIVRPSLVLIDDPQTDDSARSPSQCDYRERILTGAVLGLAGPGVRMAALASVTIIRPDDLADRLVNRERHPDWKSERTRLVYEWGNGGELWEQYEQIRRDPELGREAATDFYKRNRKAMDDGAVVGWDARYEPGQLSALQYAHDLRIDRGDEAFRCEYQNDPIPAEESKSTALEPDIILERTVTTPRGVVPSEATVLTAGFDVQQATIYFVVCAWTDSARGWVVDYGTVPQTASGLLALQSVRPTLQEIMPDATEEAQIANGCRLAFERVCGIDWRTETGSVMRVDRALIDSGWGRHTATVRAAVRGCRYAVNTAKGLSIGAKSTRSLTDGKRRPGERIGLNWKTVDPIRAGTTVRECLIDVNYWKSWVAARFRTKPNTDGAVVLCGDRPADMRMHQQFAEQLASEDSVLVEARGRRVEEWMLRRPNLDNHLLDCMVLASVAASMAGVAIRDTKIEEVEQEEISLLAIQQSRTRR